MLVSRRKTGDWRLGARVRRKLESSADACHLIPYILPACLTCCLHAVEAEAQTVGSPVVERQRLNAVGKAQKSMASPDVVQYYQYNADRCVTCAPSVVVGCLDAWMAGWLDGCGCWRSLTPCWDSGDLQSQVVVGQLHMQGQGVAQDHGQAIRYFQQVQTANRACMHANPCSCARDSLC